MKQITFILLSFLLPAAIFAQANSSQNIKKYKKKVLDHTEIDILSSIYNQKGENAAVTGGIGNEKLTDFATNIVVAIPVNSDDVISIDATVSAYTSASSSNLNPFTGASISGASRDDDKDDDDKSSFIKMNSKNITGSPWVESTGASRSDVWVNGIVGYSHTSDDRNGIFTGNISFATEFDYTSFGGGIGYNRLFNKKNTEFGIKGNIYLDKWNPAYPTEIISYVKNNGNLNIGYFKNVNILDSNGNIIDKNGSNIWKIKSNTLVVNKARNTYSFSLLFSQILSKRAQISVFGDVVLQKGWLSNPMQRVYFADFKNYYIGNAASIPIYDKPNNKDVFQLADDIERLPSSRLKFPIGVRLNYYINEFLVFRTYYRYYFDDWKINSHTINVELPIKIHDKLTVYPSFRYYSQTGAIYFAPYESHLSTETFYTSDFDLSKFTSKQFGLGIKYNDIFTKVKLFNMGLKTLGLNLSHYIRSTDFHSNIISMHAKFVLPEK